MASIGSLGASNGAHHNLSMLSVTLRQKQQTKASLQAYAPKAEQPLQAVQRVRQATDMPGPNVDLGKNCAVPGRPRRPAP